MSNLKYSLPAPRDGFQTVVKPGDSGLKYIHFGLLYLKGGGEWSAAADGKEAVFLLQGGGGRVRVEENSGAEMVFLLLPRRSLFHEKPSLVYFPPDTKFTIAAGPEGLSGAYIEAPARHRGVPFHVTPDLLTQQTVGEANWQRFVTLATIPECGARKLIIGETINPPGNWSSYPPHKHDTLVPEVEVPMEEVYHYRFSPPGGFAIQRVYDPPGGGERLEEVAVVEEGDSMVLPRGYHPVVAAPGYSLYYLWVLAGEENSYGAWSDDPAHKWILQNR